MGILKNDPLKCETRPEGTEGILDLKMWKIFVEVSQIDCAVSKLDMIIYIII